MMDVFCDAETIRRALAFEAALADAQAAEGVIPADAAQAIGRACSTAVIDPEELAEEAALAGTLAIPLVRRLRDALPAEHGGIVHRGATSQDVADSVLMMQVVAAASLLLHDVDRVRTALSARAATHAATPAVGRTLLQDALPIGFGLRLAQAAAGIGDAGVRLAAEVRSQARLQLGGAAGTRAALDGRGAAIARRMAGALGLAEDEPWHGRRDGLAGIAASLGILIGALGKFARDVSLLAQNPLGEAREPVIAGRGGSSVMAHKRNPTGCQIALSAALRAPGLVSGILAGLPQEQERGLGGWQAEGPALIDLFLLASGSAAALADVAEGLEIDTDAIARNLTAAAIGTDIGESAAIVDRLVSRRRNH